MDPTTATLLVGAVGVAGTLLAALGSQLIANGAARKARYEEKLAELLLDVATVREWMQVEREEWVRSWHFGEEKKETGKNCPIYQVQALSICLDKDLYQHTSQMVKAVSKMRNMPGTFLRVFGKTSIEHNNEARSGIDSSYDMFSTASEQFDMIAMSKLSNRHYSVR